MTPPIPADQVGAQAFAKEDFFQRHRKDRARADDVWRSLVAKRQALLADSAYGPVFHPPTLPASLQHYLTLRVIKGLPRAFRAVYAVFRDPRVGLVVEIEWVGDHKEYDGLFGYSTS